MFRSFLTTCAVLAAFASAWLMPEAIAAAGTFPDKPLRIIVPSSPGGILDISSRLVAKGLSEKLGQTVVVENMAGAGGIIGMERLLRAEADGYTMVMGSLGPNAANYALYRKLPYKLEDFTPIINVISMPSILVVHPSVPATSLNALRDYARAKPGGLSMAISTAGASGHLIGELLKARLDMPAINVIYKGASPAITDLAGGQVDFMIDNLVSAQPLIQAGKVRAVAIFTNERSALLPDVPTVGEQGYPDLVGGTWIGLLAKAGTPADVVAKLNGALAQVLADPTVQATFVQQGGVTQGGTPADFDRFIRVEKDRWEKVIRAANIKID